MFKKMFVILCVILTISIALNILLIVKGGITVNNKYDQRQDQRQFQFQGQLMMNFIIAQGNKIEWIIKEFSSLKEVTSCMSEIPPQESFFSHIIRNDDTTKYELIYPHFIEEKK